MKKNMCILLDTTYITNNLNNGIYMISFINGIYLIIINNYIRFSKNNKN